MAWPCLALACHALALACRALAWRGLGMAWPWHGLALTCLALPWHVVPWLGIAPFKAFRESEAIGSLAWRGLPCVGMSWPRPWHALACHALALPCVGMSWP
ncbi:unnamed protein product [Prunus brigantina]